MNEFWRCPCPLWGSFIITLLFALIIPITLWVKGTSFESIWNGEHGLQELKTTVFYPMAALIVLQSLWGLWSFGNWISPNENCRHTGYMGTNSNKFNPFSSTQGTLNN